MCVLGNGGDESSWMGGWVTIIRKERKKEVKEEELLKQSFTTTEEEEFDWKFLFNTQNIRKTLSRQNRREHIAGFPPPLNTQLFTATVEYRMRGWRCLIEADVWFLFLSLPSNMFTSVFFPLSAYVQV